MCPPLITFSWLCALSNSRRYFWLPYSLLRNAHVSFNGYERSDWFSYHSVANQRRSTVGLFLYLIKLNYQWLIFNFFIFRWRRAVEQHLIRLFMLVKPQNKVKYLECKVQGPAAARQTKFIASHKLKSCVFLHFLDLFN